MNERFLANENFPLEIANWLGSQGHDVIHASSVLVGEKDPIILEAALSEDRVLLTFDQDFGELVRQQKLPPSPGIVLFRVHRLSPVAKRARF